MRVLILIAGMLGVVGGAAAADPARYDAEAPAGQLVYQLSFGGARDTAPVQSFQLQFANDWQREAGVAPWRAEYRPGTRQFLLNGIDLGQTLVARQVEEGFGSTIAGWIPMLVVLSAASLILIDGQRWAEDAEDGTGASGS